MCAAIKKLLEIESHLLWIWEKGKTNKYKCVEWANVSWICLWAFLVYTRTLSLKPAICIAILLFMKASINNQHNTHGNGFEYKPITSMLGYIPCFNNHSDKQYSVNPLSLPSCPLFPHSRYFYFKIRRMRKQAQAFNQIYNSCHITHISRV